MKATHPTDVKVLRFLKWFWVGLAILIALGVPACGCLGVWLRDPRWGWMALIGFGTWLLVFLGGGVALDELGAFKEES